MKFSIIILNLFLSGQILASDWTMFVYMDSSDDLSDMAIKNITDMALGGASETANIVIQLHAFGDTAIRYKIEKNTLVPLEYIAIKHDSKQDLIDALTWAFGTYKSLHNMLVLWNHGWGILDPQWNPEKKEWQVEPDVAQNFPCNYCPKKMGLLAEIDIYNHVLHKGFIFRAKPRIYLTNQDLVDTLKYVYEKILNGQKLDILGFDTCMGAMFEISYQIEPFINYHIGSQNCELKDGWDYQAVCSLLQQKSISAKELAHGIVESFEQYYKPRALDGVYTHAAVDLSYVSQIHAALNTIIEQIQICYNKYGELKDLVQAARHHSPRFCFVPMYTDLYRFVEQLLERLAVLQASESLELLKNSLILLQALIKKAVIHNVGGHKMAGIANGISIYFPDAHIDSSYYNTQFAQDSQWLDFLNLVIQ